MGTTPHPAPATTLAVIGAGPSCTYVLERLAATAVAHGTAGRRLDIHIFDRTGQFGAGQVHSPEQPVTSYLNRIVGQVGFAADESVEDAGPLLAPADRPTLLEWCRSRFRDTGDPVFDLAAEDWPKRYIHGQALRDRFDFYVRMLRERAGASVVLHRAEVVDLDDRAADGRLAVVTSDGDRTVRADQVLILTGHSSNDPRHYARQRGWAEFAREHGARFVPSAYPLENAFAPGEAGPGTVVGCLGMGLTAIDVILHLTEGRGGTFRTGADGRPEYHRSGAEPDAIAVFSRAGLFTFARPYNAKERAPQELEHRGVFLVPEAVRRLRAAVGTPRRVGDRIQRQLDFRAHLLPVLLLEMAHLYYTTLFGPAFGARARHAAGDEYEAFLADGGAGAAPEDAQQRLLAPLERAVDEAVHIVDGVLSGARTHAETVRETPWADEAVRRYLTVVFGAESAKPLADLLDAPPVALADAVAAARSPYRHPTSAEEHRFSWTGTVHPLAGRQWDGPDDYTAAVLDFMDRDHRWAAQDNLTNPAKAAADGVWRDLRDVLADALDFGGLLAPSHRDFLDVFMRHHNRLCNGAALEVMEKMRALIRAGTVDVSAGPDARVLTDADSGRYQVEGPATGATIPVDILVDSRVHPFDAEHDASPFYPNLLRRGLIRKWRNPGTPAFVPGGLDLTPGFHPLSRDGRPDPRLTILGPPSEGVMFFQLGALRPYQNHHVMQDILCWIRDFWKRSAE
ncbi:FAD/NAD(P)-binding protein [Streptomyces acidiscabies]|uniref:FAD/NAD(P)-binding protein n=1 Tax=Streptomyces acidiscabies TaxID=42234 RepID=UPI0009512875|nr:FAD/NAD(P)-binding protein [Streptomyces acidiscabies]